MTARITPHAIGMTEVAPGRHMGWASFGDESGDPVFWFHGTPGARSQLPHDIDAAAYDARLRIIGVERPGTGDSSEYLYSNVAEFARDLLKVADDLGIESFGCVGLSGGGPYLLAVAHEAPHRMKAGVVLGGIGPTRGPDAVLSHTMLLVPAATLINSIRQPLARCLSAAVRSATPFADPMVKLFFGLMPGDRAEFNSRPHDLDQFTHDLIHAVQRTGIAAAVDDLILFGRDWGFKLGDIRVPITFYGGSSDVIVPYLHAERQAKRVPNGRLRTLDGRGHFAGYTDPEGVLNDIRDNWPIGSEGSRVQPTSVKLAAAKPAAKKPAAKKASATRTAASTAKKPAAKKPAAKKPAAKKPAAKKASATSGSDRRS